MIINSLACIKIKKIIFTVFLLLIGISCSKAPGKTSSKIKIFSGNFTTVLSTTANNGLILYGKSADGQFFTKKIDTDTIDLVFSNGAWSFYAISWELVTAPSSGVLPNFSGKTYCGQTTAVFNGTDTSLSLNLSNAGCNDPAFSANAKVNSGIVDLTQVKILTCKSLSGITSLSTTACDQNLTAKFNKGYATSYRVVAFEGKNFGDIVTPVRIAQSVCVRADYSTLTGMLNSSDGALADFIGMRLPDNYSNGLKLAVEVFYSSGAPGTFTPCDTTGSSDLLPITDNPRLKNITDTSALISAHFLYVQSNEIDICKAPRLGTTSFSAGFGSPGSPYAICTKEQLNLLRTNFTSYSDASFDLLTDVDYGMSLTDPIGSPLLDTGTAPVSYYGKKTGAYNPVFDGKNHKISNFMINCSLPNPGATPNNEVGFFREIKDATVKNLILNSAVVMCKGSYSGGLAGRIIDTTGTTAIDNIKVHGHTEALAYSGAVAGSLSGTNITATRIHAKGEFSGGSYVGGLFGGVTMTNGGTLSQLSFNGKVNGNQGSGNNSNTSSLSYVGGLIGYASNTSGTLTLSQAVVKAFRIDGSTTVGGLIGESSNVTIADSYVEANLRASGNTDGATYGSANLGGIVGKATNGSLSTVFFTNGIKTSNRNTTLDHTVGGLIGGGSGAGCSNSFFTGENDSTSYGTCGVDLIYPFDSTSYGFTMPVLVTTFPTSLTSCSVGNYYEVGTASVDPTFGNLVVGDIIFCKMVISTPTNVVIHSADRDLAMATNFKWYMPDNLYDIPRLTFEKLIEQDVPYLKRLCHGHYLTQFGGGGSAVDPKWVCNYDQFVAMATNTSSYYSLMRDIIAPTSTHTPLASGAYKLEGGNHALLYFTMSLPSTLNNATANVGIFSNLSAGSVVNNLRVVGANLSGSVGPSGTSFLNAGIVAGTNNGLLQNVSIDLSNANLNATSVAGTTISFAGLVGVNNGTIRKSEVDAITKVSDGSYPYGSLLYAAGVVGQNNGNLEAVKIYSSFTRSLSCTSASPVDISAHETLGSVVALNTGTGIIKEVDNYSGFMVMNAGSYSNCPLTRSGHTSPFVANNQGQIYDFSTYPRYSTFGLSEVPPAPEIFSLNNGTVARGFVTFDSFFANSIAIQDKTYVGSWDVLNDPTGTSVSGYTSTSCANSGEYVDVTSDSSTAVFNSDFLYTGDILLCINHVNTLIRAANKSGIMTGMSDVFYLVNRPLISPPLLDLGRFFSDSLQFSISGTNLLVDDMTNPSSPSSMVISSVWNVGSDFFNPGSTVWDLQLDNSSTTTTKIPELVRTSGGMEEIGIPF